MDKLVSPTGQSPRGEDQWGSGRFLASRATRPHLGVDYVSTPGQEVVSPCDGTFVRVKRPYAGEHLSGLLIRSNDGLSVTLFYVRPDEGLKEVHKGQRVGLAQSLSYKYPGITEHVHMEVTWPNGKRLPDEWVMEQDYLTRRGTIYVNPILLIGA